MEECESLYQNGQECVCFQRLVKLIIQKKDSIPLQALNLLLKLINQNSQLYLNTLKKARSIFQQIYSFDEIMRAFNRGEKINASLFNKNEVRIYIEVSIKLARSILESGKIDESKATILELLKIIKIFDNTPLKWLIERIHDMIVEFQRLNLVPRDPPQKQIQVYQTLLEDQEELNILKQEGLFGYLIPMRWFRKWQGYVQDSSQVEDIQDLDKIKEESLFSQVSQQDIDTLYQIVGIETSAIEEELDADYSHPGPIDGSQLIEIQWDLLIDNFQPKQYQNYQIKSNLVEGMDFIIVSHKIWKYLKEQYGAFEIKRIIIKGQDLKPIVDLQAKLVKFIIFPQIEMFSVVVGNKENFDALNKKITRLFEKKINTNGIFPQTKWLKFLNLDEQDNFFQNLNKNGPQPSYNLKANELDLRTPLDEIDIVDQDILLLDFKINNKWQITLQVAQKLALDLNQKTPQSIASMINYYNISGPARLMNESKLGLTGLQNLGNTCFMNSALQCLSNIYELTEYLVSNKFVQDLNPKNPIGTKGQLALNYADLMKILWFGKQSSVSPFEIKRVIAKHAPQFVGYGQQDSQELLSYVLDGLHEDLNRILQKPIVEEAFITKQSDFDAANIFWQNYKRRNDSIIIDLVAGQFKSTLICPDCKSKKLIQLQYILSYFQKF